MLNQLTIFIPSSGRVDRQITLAQLPPAYRKRTTLAVPSKEYDAYCKRWPDDSVSPIPVMGISETRKWLMGFCRTRYCMMLDDDMVFAYRPVMSSPKLLSVSAAGVGVSQLMTYWLGLMKQFAHVGLSARQGNNHVSEPYKTCCRMFNAYTYDLAVLEPLLRAGKVVPGRLPVMEDFDLTLQLLRAGHPNAVIYRWCWNQPGSNAAGGCSQYRTGEMQAQAATELARLHPGFVRVVEKESKNWDGMNKRMDVTVYWQKAYQSSGKGGK